jgi:hypothetical protein
VGKDRAVGDGRHARQHCCFLHRDDLHFAVADYNIRPGAAFLDQGDVIAGNVPHHAVVGFPSQRAGRHVGPVATAARKFFLPIGFDQRDCSAVPDAERRHEIGGMELDGIAERDDHGFARVFLGADRDA